MYPKLKYYYFQLLNEKLDTLIKETPISIIGYHEVDTTKILDKYFKSEKPFNEGEKKAEFPDAFNLEALELWCEKNNSKIYVLSTDKDLLEYQSSKLIPIEEITALLDLINRKKEEKSRAEEHLNKVLKLYKTNKEKLEDDILNRFGNEVEFETGETNLEEIEVFEVSLSDYTIVELNMNEAVLEAKATVYFKAYLSYLDYENAFWDSEDEKYYFLEETTSSLEKTIEIPVELEVDLEPLAGAEFSGIEVSEIGKDFVVDLDSDELGHEERYR